jgi:GntR family histidine utilization transcriptional repressor
MSEEFTLDGQGPLYLQIKRAIAEPIVNGRLRPGKRIPPEHELMDHFGTSRMTVNRALHALGEDGLILRRRRRGTFVAAQSGEQAVLSLNDISREITESGALHDYELIARQRMKASKGLASDLEVTAGTPLLKLTCRHLADGVPHVMERRWINLRTVPAAAEISFKDAPPGSWLLENIPWSEAEHKITACNADDELAELLEIEEGAACLEVRRRTWRGGQLVTAVTLLYPGERHVLVGRFTPGA